MDSLTCLTCGFRTLGNPTSSISCVTRTKRARKSAGNASSSWSTASFSVSTVHGLLHYTRSGIIYTGWYKTRRRHSALSYRSPLEFERFHQADPVDGARPVDALRAPQVRWIPRCARAPHRPRGTTCSCTDHDGNPKALTCPRDRGNLRVTLQVPVAADWRALVRTRGYYPCSGTNFAGFPSR